MIGNAHHTHGNALFLSCSYLANKQSIALPLFYIGGDIGSKTHDVHPSSRIPAGITILHNLQTFGYSQFMQSTQRVVVGSLLTSSHACFRYFSAAFFSCGVILIFFLLCGNFPYILAIANPLHRILYSFLFLQICFS